MVDDFRIYQAGLFEKDPADLIASIKGERKPTYAMNIGTLIHAYFEKGTKEIDGDKLKPEEIAQLDLVKTQIGDAWIHELFFRELLTEDILISAKVDQVAGIIGSEIKTGGRFYGVDFYADSVQWKIYSEMLGLQRFDYFHIQYNQKRPYTFKLSSFSFYRYPGMREEITRICQDFITWVDSNGLIKYLEFNLENKTP